MTIHIPAWLVLSSMILVPPYLWCRLAWHYTPKSRLPYQEPYRFTSLDSRDQLLLIFANTLKWVGGIHAIGPYALHIWLPVEWLPARWSVILGLGIAWTVAGVLFFTGEYIEGRIKAGLEKASHSAFLHETSNHAMERTADRRTLHP
jgi:hypothetical protein